MKINNSFDEIRSRDATDRMPGFQWDELRRRVFERDGNKCIQCGDVATDCDHITPVALGGTNDPENLQSLCSRCHDVKTKKDIKKIAAIKRINKQFKAGETGGGFL